ncbi:MAG TPA: isoprenylcysteine carboxylmethyltransferase family protein [Lacipirellulaceae bacterium]|nr:isoprenylcysteine carboxylmethyltransferase family protein [Lacipirellulaceae bacterium]
MSRVLYLVYGVVAYLLFLAAILYGIGFVGDLDFVPEGINGGPPTTITTALVINISLLLLFALQHNVMARPWFKDWWTRFMPRAIERSTYVAAASLILLLLYWQWRPIPETVWEIENVNGRRVLWGVYFAGWAMVLVSSFAIDHFELFGLKQVWRHYNGQEQVSAPFSERSLYRWLRHPLMLGFIIAFWAAPTMTLGRLLFALVTTLWILIAIQIEERDLARFLGEPYRDYRERTPMLLPLPRRSRGDTAASGIKS